MCCTLLMPSFYKRGQSEGMGSVHVCKGYESDWLKLAREVKKQNFIVNFKRALTGALS